MCVNCSKTCKKQLADTMINRFFFRIDPSKVYFLRFILEGYDNLFVLSTIDRQDGLVEVHYVESAMDDLCTILTEIGDFIGLRS